MVPTNHTQTQKTVKLKLYFPCPQVREGPCDVRFVTVGCMYVSVWTLVYLQFLVTVRTYLCVHYAARCYGFRLQMGGMLPPSGK